MLLTFKDAQDTTPHSEKAFTERGSQREDGILNVNLIKKHKREPSLRTQCFVRYPTEPLAAGTHAQALVYEAASRERAQSDVTRQESEAV